ncbi:hypothetical protein IH879_19170 [candidate division KSB1 bacterium]|nr:hypothetical protein [candidate division KSB1 bacterium]
MKRTIQFIAAGLMTLSLTLHFSACTEQSPLTPELSETQSSGFKILKVKNPSLKKEFERSRWIGPFGGTIVVGTPGHGISRLSVPFGALSTWIQINFWWESTGFLEGGADFSPHGTKFNLPVRVELSYKGADLTGVNEDNLEIRYYNETTGQWELIGNQVDKVKKVVIGYTDHFSRYAIGAE